MNEILHFGKAWCGDRVADVLDLFGASQRIGCLPKIWTVLECF